MHHHTININILYYITLYKNNINENNLSKYIIYNEYCLLKLFLDFNNRDNI